MLLNLSKASFNITSIKLSIPALFVVNFHKSSVCSAGHSKWANIRHTKALKDGQKSLIFTKLARQIQLAIMDNGSANPTLNTPLRNVIDIATKQNMPQATIQNILKKFSNPNTSQYKKLNLEIRAFNKIFIICVLYTPNNQGTRQNIMPILKRVGATITPTRHMFFEKGIVETYGDLNSVKETKTIDEMEQICTEHAIDCGAEELEIFDFEMRHLSFICDPTQINQVQQKLAATGYKIEHTEHVYIPNNPIVLSSAEQTAYSIFKNKLLNFEGVDNIYDNIDIDPDV